MNVKNILTSLRHLPRPKNVKSLVTILEKFFKYLVYFIGVVSIVGFLIYFDSSLLNEKNTILNRETSKIKRHIRNINNGGCRYFAYYLYTELKKNGYNCSLVVVDRDLPTKLLKLSEIRYNNINTSSVKLSFGHVLVKLNDGNLYLDANGLNTTRSTRFVYCTLYGGSMATIDSNDAAILIQTKGWNPKFDLNDTQELHQAIKNIKFPKY